MLVATFGPSTGWVGKTITFEGEQFVLEGHGPVSAADVLTYDQQGHLVWAYEGLREWVQEMNTASLARPPAPQKTVSAYATRTPRADRSHRRFFLPLWAWAIVIGCVLIAGIVGVSLREDPGTWREIGSCNYYTYMDTPASSMLFVKSAEQKVTATVFNPPPWTFVSVEVRDATGAKVAEVMPDVSHVDNLEGSGTEKMRLPPGEYTVEVSSSEDCEVVISERVSD